jgi:hypothetical protein
MAISVTPAVTAHPGTHQVVAGGARASVRTLTQNIRHVTLGNVLSGQVTGLTLGETYTFRVRAYDAAGNGSQWSDPIQVTTVSQPTPATVAATSAIPTPSGPPTVTAVRVAAVAAIPGPAAGLQRAVTVGNVTTGQVTGLLPGQNYTARVRARDAAGNWSAWSTSYPFTTTGSGTVAPATVVATTAFPTGTIGGTPPTVTAGRSRPVVRGGTVGLDVTATPPGGATIIGYSWAITSGGGSLTNATTATPTYTAPGSGSGLVTIRATVQSSNAGVATADVTVSYHATIIAAENALTGTARATWDLASPNLGGVSTLQGFVDGFTVDKTGTVNFKIAQSDAAGWSAELFRLGYYNGDGARSYGTITPSGGQVTASQAQPSPGDADANTTLLSADAGNWSTTLTWTPPAWAPTGMYVLRLNRTGGGASHVMFILRDDARHADLMFMPADSTWQAYNAWGGMDGSMYGGNSLYYGTSVDQYNADAARFVSYNRPIVNRGAADSGRSYGAVEWSTFFTSEYGMLRFLERNGYDVKYYGCIDAAGDATGTHLTGNGSTRGGVGAAMFVGHNEYWSDGMRAGWETAKAAGLSVFSCAGNEVFWRLVGSANDADGRPRTWECYKSTIAARGSTGRTEWTGTWRDPDGAGKGGDRPENTFTGTIFVVNGPDLRSLVVPYNGGYSGQPLWRNTSVASLTAGQTYTSGNQILGFEWDTYGPAGVSTTAANYLAAPHPSARYCSDVTYSISSGLLLTDAGDVYNAAGTATHRLVAMPSGNNGGITFGTGTVNWAFGVDDANTYQQGTDNTDTVLRQATVNILMDMGAAPSSLMSGLTSPSAVDWFANPGTVAAVTAIPGPTVVTSGSATPAPAVVAGVAAVAAPTVRLGVAVAPATVAAVAATPAATVRLSVLPAPGTVTASTTVAGTALRYTGALADSFDDGILDTTLWSLSHDTMGESGGRAFVQCGSGFPAISTGNAYALDRFHVQVFPAARNTATTEATTGVMFQSPSVPGGTDIGFVFDRVNDLLRFVSRTGYFDGGEVTMAFSAATASAWVRLSLSGGNVLWDTSTDGLTWTNRRTLTAPAWVTAAGDGRVLFEAHRSDGTANNSEFDNFNVVPATVAPATVTAVAAVASPTVRLSVAAGPVTVAAVATVPAPTVRIGAAITPATVGAVAAVPGPAIQTASGTTVAPAVVAAVAAVPGPAVQTSSGTTVNAATVQAVTAVGAAAVTAGTGRTPATVAAVAAVGTPTVIATNSPAPGTVVAVTTVPAPAMATGTRPGPATVTAVTVIATPTAGGTVATTPATVTATATIPAATARIYAQVIAATVVAVVQIGTIRHTVGQVITSTGTATLTGGMLPGTIIGDTLPARLVDGTP